MLMEVVVCKDVVLVTEDCCVCGFTSEKPPCYEGNINQY
jgi:hypothetical protein